MFPVAVTCGNTFILKPSEKDPGNSDLLLGSVAIEHYLLHDTMNYIILENNSKFSSPLDLCKRTYSVVLVLIAHEPACIGL